MKYTVTVEGKEPREIEVWETEEGLFARLGDRTHRLDAVSIDGANFYSLLVDQQSHEVFLEEREDIYAVVLHGRLYEVVVESEGARQARVSPARLGAAHQVAGGRTVIKSPMPGLVVSLPVTEGQVVTEGQRLAVLEAMKMENEIRAPRAGTVQRVDVAVGDSVMQGQTLLTLS